jgi:DNA-binding transcriptional MerR regulator
MVHADGLSLRDLSQQSGIAPRTLRSWIQQGLLPRPSSPGRHARYPRSAAARARAIKTLQDGEGLSLAEIRRRLVALSEVEIARWEAIAGDRADLRAEPNLASVPLRPPHDSDVRAFCQADAVPPPGPPIDLARLKAAIRKFVGAKIPSATVARQTMTQFSITPDIALTVRGPLTPQEMVQFDSVARLLRSILTGGMNHETET